MATGLLGAGYTGSYIFSQTVFTMRQGVFNRINGARTAGARPPLLPSTPAPLHSSTQRNTRATACSTARGDDGGGA